MKLRLNEQMNKLEEQCSNPLKSFGGIYTDLKQLIQLLTKVIKYYEAKNDPLSQPQIASDQEEEN